MRLEDIAVGQPSRSFSYARLLEKIEILRSSLRWGRTDPKEQIVRALGQCNDIRDEVLKLSRQERLLRSKPAQRVVAVESGRQDKISRKQALLDRNFVFEGVFGESPELLESLEIAEKAAPTPLPVLIYGESGTGKELMARVIHNNGSRRDGPYVSINCGAIPENLIESELFGHKKGAFTGATSDRAGKFESANGGTIFLDEIGELPLSGQVKLLRVLQSSELQRVGSDKIIYVDTRVVAATNRDLAAMCARGEFREDLYFRLGVIDITVPPLRQRRDEIPLLIDYFATEAAEMLNRAPVQLAPRLRTLLMNYDYPGNIRELRNIIYRISCLADEVADIMHLPSAVRSGLALPDAQQKLTKGKGCAAMLERPLAQVKKEAADAAEKLYLQQGLIECRGKVVELARKIGMNRSHVWTLIKKHGIDVKQYADARAQGR